MAVPKHISKIYTESCWSCIVEQGKKSDYILLSCFHIQLLKEPGVVHVKNTPKTITLSHIKPANCTPCSIKTILIHYILILL